MYIFLLRLYMFIYLFGYIEFFVYKCFHCLLFIFGKNAQFYNKKHSYLLEPYIVICSFCFHINLNNSCWTKFPWMWNQQYLFFFSIRSNKFSKNECEQVITLLWPIELNLKPYGNYNSMVKYKSTFTSLDELVRTSIQTIIQFFLYQLIKTVQTPKDHHKNAPIITINFVSWFEQIENILGSSA